MGRIQVREHVLADLDAYFAWQSDHDVARHVAWLPKNAAESRASLVDAIAQQVAVPRLRHFFAVVHTDTGEVIGDVGFTVVAPGTGDCGWFIRGNYWGSGYATEAVKLLMEHAFGTVRLDRLTASCSIANLASEKVMIKCGFHCVRRSETRVRYEIVRHEWNPQA